MKKFVFILFFIFVFNLSCLAEKKQLELKKPLLIDDLSNAALREKIASFIQEVLQVPPQYEITVNFSKETSGDNLIVLDITFSDGKNTQKEKFYLTADQKFLITGKVYDLSKDYRAEILKKINTKGAVFKGNEKAKVVVVEYSDFQCPYCEKAFTIWGNSVWPKYKDKIKFIYKQFPLNFHNWAETAAVATECAYLQDKNSFWILHDFFFSNQQKITLENIKQELQPILKQQELNEKKFIQCLDNKETLNKIKNDMQEAQSVGVNSTPTFFINGKKITGAQPAENFISIIEEELKKK